MGINSHELKQKVVTMYGMAFNILIETGTYMGDMVHAQLGNFKTIYTIELSDNLYTKACCIFKKDRSKVKLYLGDSGMLLPQILKKINEPVLFWLDGHYSSGITAKGAKETPIREELQAIMKHPFKHTILIDDARCFTGKNDYPTLEEIKQMTPGYEMSVTDDIIRLT